MGPRIADSTRLLTPDTPLDVVAYGCTSASMAIGEDGVFAATEVLAKHDENYMPPEVADALEATGHVVPANDG